MLLGVGCARTDDGREIEALAAALASARASAAAVGLPGPAAAAPSVVAPTPAAADGDRSAAALLGQPPEALRAGFGEPALRRAEGDAEIWLYTAPGCALDLVLYRRAGRLAVAHAAARARGTGAMTEAACIAGIAAGAVPPTTPATPAAAGLPGPSGGG